ncbi:MAG: glycosyltransferase family 4 protein [Chloroflexota bacterium]|nr:MAG: hypothetical protein DIU68_10315 [Chloroflexota bacterium]
MRVTILTQYYPPEFGAAAVRLGRLAAMLADAGHEVTVLTGMPNYPTGIIPEPYRGKLVTTEKAGAVTIRRVWVYASPKKSIAHRLLNQFSFALTAAVGGLFLPRPDVILVESHPLFVCLAGGWLKRLKRAPVVLNVSDLWPESAVAVGALAVDSLFVKLAARLERWAYHDAAHVVAMTEGVQSGVLKVLGRRERVSLVQNAVDLERFRPGQQKTGQAMRTRLGLSDAITVGHIGNMSLAHDFDLLLDAAKALPELTFVFAGGGSRKAHIEARIADERIGNVLLPGVLPHDDMPALWAATDICVVAFKEHPLFTGALPSKMFEALATGTPIVAAVEGEAARLLEETGAGISVPFGNRAAMISALQDLARSPEKRQAMGRAGRAYAERHLSPTRVRDAFLDIFRAVTSDYAPGPARAHSDLRSR